MLFWRVTEDEQNQKDGLTRKLADAEIGRRRFTSDLLVNLARRNQSLLYRQLEIINQLEESERDPDALAELFRLDHLATRVRRNAENLLVLSGEQPPRVWSQPVPLRDVVRAAIAETEDLDRVAFDDRRGPARSSAHAVTDVTHLLAELTENAVRFSPPDTAVTVRGRRDPRGGRGQLLTVEDWGVGMDAGRARGREHAPAPTRPRSTCRSRSGWASTSWPGSPRGTGSGSPSHRRPGRGSPRPSPCPARCSSSSPNPSGPSRPRAPHGSRRPACRATAGSSGPTAECTTTAPTA